MKTPRFISLLVLLTLVILLAACGGDSTPTPASATTEAPAPTTPVPTVALPNGLSQNAPQQWSTPPVMSIDPDATYIATLKTVKGDIRLELFAKKAPIAVNNFVFLARQGFYNNTTFHRVLEGFMAQGGDPTGTGTGGPGYTFANEVDPDQGFDRAGLLAMANSGPDTNGSQFFITFAPAPWLDGGYTIFGEMLSGQEVLNSLTLRNPDENPTTPGDALITVTIEEAAASQLPTPTPTPTPFAPDAAQTDRYLAAVPPAERIGYWNQPPALALEEDTFYLATFRTEEGDIVVELRPDLAPNSVNNFVALARAGYYDGTHFFQVIENLVAISGDPLEDGSGTPGYVIEDELQPGVFNDAGWLGVAQPGPNSNGGQFFFTMDAAPWLAERFSPLGNVIEGQEVLSRLEIRDPGSDPAPTTPGSLLQSIEITTAQTSQRPEPTPTPLPISPTLPPADERPLSSIAPADRNGYYNSAPAMQIDTKKDYVAILRTAVGDITIDLFEQQTPNTVNNFVLLALNGYYDNTTFHRVLEGFMAQAGDPTGTGAGDPGYSFADEFVTELRHDGRGVVSMANRGANTNGSQFFITFDATSWLDDQHTIFGRVIEGEDVLARLTLRDPDTATEPGTAITRIDIETR